MVGVAKFEPKMSLKLKTVCQNRNFPTFSRSAESVSKCPPNKMENDFEGNRQDGISPTNDKRSIFSVEPATLTCPRIQPCRKCNSICPISTRFKYIPDKGGCQTIPGIV